MCLGIPGKVVHWINREGTFAQAEIEFGGIQRVCSMACVTEAVEGDYVLVHAGIAISRIDPAEAERIFDELARLNDVDGWNEESSS